jgi:hypothetical protein
MLLQIKQMLLSPDVDAAAVPISAPSTWVGYLTSTMHVTNVDGRPFHLVRALALDVVAVLVLKNVLGGDSGAQFIVLELLSSCDVVEAMDLPDWEVGATEYRVSALSLLLATSLTLMKMPWPAFFRSMTRLVKECSRNAEMFSVLVDFSRVLLVGHVSDDDERDVECVLFNEECLCLKNLKREDVRPHARQFLIETWELAVEKASKKSTKAVVCEILTSVLASGDVLSATDASEFCSRASSWVTLSSGYTLRRNALSLALTCVKVVGNAGDIDAISIRKLLRFQKVFDMLRF